MCTAASLTTGSPLPAGAVAANCAAKPCFKTGCPGFPPPAESDDSVNLPIAVSPAFIGEILRPYRQRSRYLKEAVITHFRDKASEGPAATSGLITAEGKFAIEESCYIDDPATSTPSSSTSATTSSPTSCSASAWPRA